MTKNDIVNVAINSWSSDGSGITRVDDMVVFVAGGVPGDECDIRILKVAKSRAFARVEKLILPSELRTSSDCDVFGRCGGCDMRHVSYDAELEFKRGKVQDALKRIGGVDFDVPPVVASERVDCYRNKTIFQISSENSAVRFGYFRKNSHDVMDGRGCALVSPQAKETASVFCELAEKLRISDARWLQYRENASGNAQIVIVTQKASDKLLRLADELRRRCPWLVGVLHSTNADADDNVVLRGKVSILWGSERLTDTLCGYEFDISPQSFFQVNREQAEKLYDIAVSFAGLSGAERVLELYCGIGTLTLALARQAGSVVGAEIVPEAVADAKRNATHNHVENVEFICGDASEIAQNADEKYDIVVVDPPRKGLSPAATSGIVQLAPKRIIYVSCDPATLARDVKMLRGNGYALERVQPVDMFPRTVHVECVAMLTSEC